MKRKLLAAALAAGFGVAAFAQQPGATKPGTRTAGTTSSSPATASTTGTADADLVRAELDDLTSFIDTLVEEFQIEFDTEQDAQLFVLSVTHFYLTAKLQAGTNGHPGAGRAGTVAKSGK